MYVRRGVRLAIVTVLVVLLGATSTSTALADARAEAAAKAAVKKAAADFTAQNFGTGTRRLQKAVKACGPAKCSAATRAALLADLGAMQLKKGSADDAKASWAEAAKLRPGLALAAPFDVAEVHAAFAAATAASVPAPSGDFTHTPPTEAAANTPLPIYVEGGSDSIVRVVVKYRGEGGSSWKRIELKKLDSGWGGLIPCGDVRSGALRYYVQGLDDAKTPVASNGDPKHPYVVQIRDTLTGAAPHLPGKPAPKSCSESTDCPPDFPGCSKSGASAGADGEDSGEGESGGEGREGEEARPAGTFKRFWVGAGTELEFMSLPSGNDLCLLIPQYNAQGQTNPNAAQPANSGNFYCTSQGGTDFPSRADQTANNALCTAAQVANGTCPADGGGTSGGGIVRGDLRLYVSFDYAVTVNLMVGARLGATLFPYPGQAAVSDGRAFGSRFYGEARGTWVFGQDALATTGFKPLAFGGLGVAQFDGHTSSSVLLNPGGGQPLVTGPVNIWRNNGPFFLTLGGGVRWAVTDALAFVAGARVNLSFGANGMIPTFGPELEGQVGF